MKFPKDLHYTKNDEWIRVDGDTGTVGITDFAQDELSDVVYVEITAAIGDLVEKGAAFGVVESVKAASDLYMPVTGELMEINESLVDTPELVNSSPYGEAWMVKIKVTEPDQLPELLDADAYEQHTKERSG